MQLTRLFNEFFESEKTGGLLLVLVTLISLILANSFFQTSYVGLWNYHLGGHSLVHWINDGLMTLFFLLIGLELEREIYQGELSKLKNASLPILGALGGMLVPAGIYLAWNLGGPYQSGAGIPMATDIAFAVGILSLLGKRVPAALKVFLLAVAIVDDLGAIMVIAVFYTKSLSLLHLGLALGLWLVLIGLNRLKIHALTPYLIGGLVMWYLMLQSGVHATITGVLLALAVPFGQGDAQSPSTRLQHALHKPVAFVLLPLFAMANTCIILGDQWTEGLFLTSSLGILLGLCLGKPLGILLFAYTGVRLGLCTLASTIAWKHILGIGFLAGIGFTMSIFITLLAFDNAQIINHAKIAILLASVVSGLIGYTVLHLGLKTPQSASN